jgi:hypothetical protein
MKPEILLYRRHRRLRRDAWPDRHRSRPYDNGELRLLILYVEFVYAVKAAQT